MEENKLYYIKGVEDREEEVINTLLEKYPNAKNLNKYKGDDSERLYYVENDIIDFTLNFTPVGIILEKYGIELTLPEPSEQPIVEPTCPYLCQHMNPVTPVFKDGKFVGVRLLAGKHNLIIAAKDFNNGNTMKWEEAMDALKNKGLRTFDKWEAHAIFSHIEEINKCLNEYGGKELNGWNWCSTEYGSDYAWSIYFDSGTFTGGSKYNEHYVRAILN